MVIMDRLDASIQVETQLVGQDDKNRHAELQTALCGVVQVCCLPVTVTVQRSLGLDEKNG